MTKNSSEDACVPLTLTQEIGSFGRMIIFALIIAGIFRSFFFEPFSIPSGSMRPTLEVGDHLFVHKPSYGYGRFSFPFGLIPFEGRIFPTLPERGDIVVFKRVPDPFGYPYIKRIIGLPDESIEVREGRLYINDVQVPRTLIAPRTIHNESNTTMIVMEYTEVLPNGASHRIYEDNDTGSLDNTPRIIVPRGHYFVMGDNRDHSQDSRVPSMVGFVPFDYIIGRADIIFFSVNGKARIWEVWKWPWAIAWERLFTPLGFTRKGT